MRHRKHYELGLEKPCFSSVSASNHFVFDSDHCYYIVIACFLLLEFRVSLVNYYFCLHQDYFTVDSIWPNPYGITNNQVKLLWQFVKARYFTHGVGSVMARAA